MGSLAGTLLHRVCTLTESMPLQRLAIGYLRVDGWKAAGLRRTSESSRTLEVLDLWTANCLWKVWIFLLLSFYAFTGTFYQVLTIRMPWAYSLYCWVLPRVLSGFLHWALCSSVQLYAEPIQSSILVSIWSSLLCTRRSENRLKLLSHKHTFRWTLGLLAHAAWRMQPSTYKSSETLAWWCTPGACTHGISITAEALRHSPFGLPSKQPFNAPELEACVWLPERCFSLKPSETIWALPSAHRRVQFVFKSCVLIWSRRCIRRCIIFDAKTDHLLMRRSSPVN